MNLRNNIKNFLYDKQYFISNFEDNIHVYNYEKIIKAKIDIIILEFDKFTLNIKGEKLLIKKLFKNEILIEGKIKSLEYLYE